MGNSTDYMTITLTKSNLIMMQSLNKIEKRK